MCDIRLIPVSCYDGRRKVHRVHPVANCLSGYYTQLEKQGLLKFVFHDGSVTSKETLWALAMAKTTEFFLVFEYGSSVPLGHVFFNGFMGYTAYGHFGLLREHFKRAPDIAKGILYRLTNFKRIDGTPYLKELLGLTPSFNYAMCSILTDLGFQVLARLRNTLYFKAKNKYVDGILLKRTL